MTEKIIEAFDLCLNANKEKVLADSNNKKQKLFLFNMATSGCLKLPDEVVFGLFLPFLSLSGISS